MQQIFGRCLTWLIGGMIYRFPQRLYFFPENEIHEYCFMKDYQQYKEMLEDYDISERVNEVRYYTHPLYRWQLSKYFIHHAFIVLKTVVVHRKERRRSHNSAVPAFWKCSRKISIQSKSHRQWKDWDRINKNSSRSRQHYSRRTHGSFVERKTNEFEL